jgi:hypothetical protein
MLALPGTSLDMTSHRNGVGQVRLMNFNLLKGIYENHEGSGSQYLASDKCDQQRY